MRLFFATICLIVYGSLYPWQFHARELTGNPFWILAHGWPPYLGANQVKDIVVNVLFYAPLGLFGFLALSQTRLKAVAGVAPIAIGFALSCGMEMLQLFVPGRDTSAMDVLSNTAGSGVGVAFGILFASYIGKIQRSLQAIRYHQSSSLLLLICLAIRELVPFFPDYSPYRVWHKMLALTTVSAFPAGIFSTSLIEWLAVARLVETATEPPWVSGIYLALLALVPAKMLILGRTTDGMELAGAVAAYFVWHYGLRKYDRRSGALAIFFLGLIAMRRLLPFHFTGEAMPFSDVAGKLFFYGTFVWLLRDSVRRPNDSPAARSISAGSDAFPR